MPDLAEILAAAKPREELVELCVAGDLNAQFDALEAELLADAAKAATSLADASHSPEIAARMEALRQEMKAATFPFRFRALGGRAWSDLLAVHPPRHERERFNADTLPSALISACSVEPAMTIPEVEKLFEVLNQGQRDALFSAAWDANHDGTVPFSLAASAILRSSEQK